MKKIKYLLVLAMVLFLPFMVSVHADEETGSEEVKTTSKKKITVYLFRGEGCPHCAEAEEFFDELSNDEEYKEYYKLVDYEVWNDSNNAELMSNVADALGTQADGVPFIVIGKKYYSGYSAERAETLKEDIKEAYNSSDYEDVVKSVKNGTFESDSDKKVKSQVLPIVLVVSVALITVIALVFFTKEK